MMRTGLVEYSRSVTLVLTGRCNLNCVYCYEHKNDARMSYETATKILDFELNKKYNGSTYIEFFGGEPFLEFDLIKKLYDYIDANYGDQNWTIFITTNGTLIHGEIQSWLKAHKRVVCGLSLDGNKKMQDINRSNSFDDIDLDFFINTYPNQHIKMTISLNTLGDLSSGVIFCHERGIKLSSNLAYGLDWSNSENAEKLERELMTLIDYYLKHPEIKPTSLLSYPIQHLAMEERKDIIHKWCGTGTHMVAYDTDGKKYPCHFFLPCSVGKELADKSNKIEFLDEIPIEKLPIDCRECLVVGICPTCHGSNYLASGNIYIKDSNMCKLTKIILKATSYFAASAWAMGQTHMSLYEENALLKSIIMLQDELIV